MEDKKLQEIPINCTRMKPGQVERISELDRSEHVTRAYEIESGVLTQVEVDWQVPGWFLDGDGDHSLAEQLAFCRSHLDQGGVMLGAFKDDLLVGVAVVRPRLREDMAQLAFLHVSRKFRRRGIARRLLEGACEIAHSAGVHRMYVSAVPSGSALGFYLAQGYRLAESVDPELYALEPEDIHLILDL
ncbi:MAG: GNAT family N-acetyltransferase [Anaerolineales bacterium]|nr:GNAT family N-acetyltransferase [Anaerolineales bacterium]